MKRALIIVFLVLLADQALKIYIKTHYALNDRTEITRWFHIHFIENKGMAFGLEIFGENSKVGKFILTFFRILMVAGIIWYLRKIIQRKEKPVFIAAVSLILAGALGNIIDSLFYGLLFGHSNELQVAGFMPEGGGYAGFMFGNVVDMLSFPIWEGHFPSWFPFWGGEEFLFFRPIFNLADSSITLGVIILILKQKSFFGKKDHAPQPAESMNQLNENEQPDLFKSGHGPDADDASV